MHEDEEAAIREGGARDDHHDEARPAILEPPPGRHCPTSLAPMLTRRRSSETHMQLRENLREREKDSKISSVVRAALTRSCAAAAELSCFEPTLDSNEKSTPLMVLR